MLWQSVAAALALAAVQVDEGVEHGEDRRIVTVTGSVGNWGTDPDDWFRLTGLDAKLLIPAGEERETHWTVIETADELGISLSVRLNAAAGRLAPSGDHIVYPVCSIVTSSSAAFGDEERNCPPSPSADSEAERLLALGLVMTHERPETARQLLTAALAATPGPAPLAQALALKARGEAAEWLGAGFDPTDPEHDLLVASALVDYRRLAQILPDRPGVHLAIAEALKALGGYDEAHALYREIGRRWPERAFEVAVQTGALYRQQGDYHRALRQLDDYALLADGQMDGMKYHYHRAWTLALLGRHGEAERHVARGLATQPDYAYAYLLRACVRSRLGRLEEALSDEERGLELLSNGVAEPLAPVRAEIARTRVAIQALRQAIAARTNAPVTAPCEGFWGHPTRPRPRSPLIEPASSLLLESARRPA